MRRFYRSLLLTSLVACMLCASNVEAQVYYYSSTPYLTQDQVVIDSSAQVYVNNGPRYRSYRPYYGPSRFYPNGYYYTQPYWSPQFGPVYNFPRRPIYAYPRPYYWIP